MILEIPIWTALPFLLIPVFFALSYVFWKKSDKDFAESGKTTRNEILFIALVTAGLVSTITAILFMGILAVS